MLALLLTIALFAGWGLLGYAILAVLASRRNLVQAGLLAPGTGVAVTVLATFWLHRAGLPVARFGVPLALALSCAAIGLLAWRRPLFPVRRFLPFGGALLLALLATGRPMLEFGFDWLSYVNDDMANYAFLAAGALKYGFTDPIDLDALNRGLDHTLEYRLAAAHFGRPGAQLLLAWVASLTGLTPLRVFMPVILALHLVLISTVAALVCQRPRWRSPALVTCLLVGASASVALGTVSQLIAQVGGLGLLAGLVAVLLGATTTGSIGRVAATAALGAILGAGLIVFYPEVLPFGFAAYGVMLAVEWLRRGPVVTRLVIGTATALTTALLLAPYLPEVFWFFTQQARFGVTPQRFQLGLFPYYLLPSGLASFWGFQPIGALLREPWTSLTIAAGGVLLVAAAGWSVMAAWRGHACGALALVMLAAALSLFAQRAAFGLFKLTMFAAPFVLGVLALHCERGRQRGFRRVAVAALALAGINAQVTYVERSRGEGAAEEVRHASRVRITEAFQRVVSRADHRRIDLATANIALAKLQALHLVGRPSAFRSRDVLGTFLVDRDFTESAPERIARRSWTTGHFAMHDDEHPGLENRFAVQMLGESPNGTCDVLVWETGNQTIMNRRHVPEGSPDHVRAAPCEELRDFLIFTHSELGEHYYGLGSGRLGLHKLENDPLLPGRTMAGIGRYLLLETVNPSPAVRVVLELTSTYRGDSENRLPRAAVVGTERKPLLLRGRGSARVFSPVVHPQATAGRRYLALDLSVEGRPFSFERTGLMRFYGRDVPLDARRLVAFSRNVSLVSDEEYRVLRPPQSVASFPSDLTRRDLEYAGVYEDGWVGEEWYVVLSRPQRASTLEIRGVVPRVEEAAFRSECGVFLDGRELGRQSLGVGEFAVRVAVAPGDGRSRIEVRCSRFQHLPSGDGRPVLALVRFVGFTGDSSGH